MAGKLGYSRVSQRARIHQKPFQSLLTAMQPCIGSAWLARRHGMQTGSIPFLARACTTLPLPSTSSESGRLRLPRVDSSRGPRIYRLVDP